ncbi:unnamed protein product [Mytilus edulis]|uniref:Uncharacterized protein n=1 Tax=Mytilus edulis TaxID=6550 RepID=A0A8S3QJI8_MYTED|nr:unnamed protein product [Mytilus edulis]
MNLTLQQIINTNKNGNIYGTCLLPDGKMVFSSSTNIFKSGTITVLNANGSLSFEVKLPSSFDVTYITEDNTLAVSSGSSGQCISIIDMQNQKVKKTIHVNGFIYGIIFNESKLIYSGRLQGIQMINPNDKTRSNIVEGEMPKDCYISTFGDKFVHTNPNENTVKCYDLQGQLHWTFQDKSVLQTPAGISVDNSGNVYVVGRKSNNLIMISPDGKQQRQLLSLNEGLSKRCAIHFSKERNMLIVATKIEKVFLYSVN